MVSTVLPVTLYVYTGLLYEQLICIHITVHYNRDYIAYHLLTAEKIFFCSFLRSFPV